MPDKSHKIAKRQAQLRERRKKLHKGPSGIPSATSSVEEAVPPATETPSSVQKTAAQPAPTSKRRTEAMSVSPKLVGVELRRIILITGTLFVILVVVSLVLR